MQLFLSIDELEFLKHVIDGQNRLSCDATPPLVRTPGQFCLRDQLEIGRDLSNKRLTRNLELGFDELEDLADSLQWCKKRLVNEISLVGPAVSSDLERQRFILEHLLEEVTEACAMV